MPLFLLTIIIFGYSRFRTCTKALCFSQVRQMGLQLPRARPLPSYTHTLSLSISTGTMFVNLQSPRTPPWPDRFITTSYDLWFPISARFSGGDPGPQQKQEVLILTAAVSTRCHSASTPLFNIVSHSETEAKHSQLPRRIYSCCTTAGCALLEVYCVLRCCVA